MRAATIIGRRFRFRPVLTVFVALGLLLALSLGNWQLARLDWKLDLINKVETRIGAEPAPFAAVLARRSEERRVGKECRSRWSPYH